MQKRILRCLAQHWAEADYELPYPYERHPKFMGIIRVHGALVISRQRLSSTGYLSMQLSMSACLNASTVSA